MKMHLLKRNQIFDPRQRKRGITIVYIGLLLTMIIGLAAFSLDMAWLYSRKAVAQKAADAAALAGAWQYANFHPELADYQATQYAGMMENGRYSVTDPPLNPAQNILRFEYQPNDETGVKRYNWYRATVSRVEPTFFAGIFGSRFKSMRIGATATALYETLADLNINGGGAYGVAPGPVNLSVFGPNGNYNNGDCYSVMKLPNGQPNPLYTGNGYDFTIKLNSTMRTKNAVYFQIFDPDCYNASGANADGKRAVDEYRGSGEGTTSVADATKTRYRLYYDNNTPYDTTDDVLVKDTSWKVDANSDLIWNDYASFNPRAYGDG
ncbi:hypothetical protein EON80_14505, partial [bacterium]